MTPDTVVLFAIFVVGAFVGMRVESLLAKQRRAA
jgi:hypothetical protein